jgi:hypothetical protein
MESYARVTAFMVLAHFSAAFMVVRQLTADVHKSPVEDTPTNDCSSAIADVGRWCIESRLCFALPTFDHVPPKSLGRRV